MSPEIAGTFRDEGGREGLVRCWGGGGGGGGGARGGSPLIETANDVMMTLSPEPSMDIHRHSNQLP